jgi:hypothetical protein
MLMDWIGVIHTATDPPSFSTITSTSLTGTNKFSGGALVGTKIVYSPLRVGYIGVLDTERRTVEAYAIPVAYTDTSIHQYSGAVAVGDKVFMVPALMDIVLVFDTTTNRMSAITGVGGSNWRYVAGVAVGSKIYCAPRDVDNVGVIDTQTMSFSTISVGVPTGTYKYRATAALGTKVYCAPMHQDNVLVIDTLTDRISTIATRGVSGTYKFNSMVAYPPLLVLFPGGGQYSVGVLDTNTDAFSAPFTIMVGSRPANLFMSASVVGNKVYTSNGKASNSGPYPIAVVSFPA